MCENEVFGDWYRGCSHFIKSYDSGETIDCNKPTCGLSSAHPHKAANCSCSKEYGESRRIVNMFHAPCDTCKREDFARRAGRQ